MRWREYHVVMTALHQAFGLPIEPLVQAKPVALRACAMAAGIVPLPVIVLIRTLLHVTAEFCGTAVDQCVCGFAYVRGKPVCAFICGKGCFEYCLNRGGMHKSRFLAPPFCKGGQGGDSSLFGQCKYINESIKPFSESIPASEA